MALHSSSFFFGQAAGPIVYGLGLGHLGTFWTLLIASLTMAALGTGCAMTLRRPEPKA
jgi:hypothetical protein